MEFSNSLRFLTGDSNPPNVEEFITAQDVNNLTVAEHVNNHAIHRVTDDSQQSTTTLWSSEKIATEIANGSGVQQTLQETFDLSANSFRSEIITNGTSNSLFLKKGSTTFFDSVLEIGDDSSNVAKISLKSTGELVAKTVVAENQLSVGAAVNGYTLPSTRGADQQILVTDSSGVVSWADPTPTNDQSLNTTDNVKFNDVSVDGTLVIGDLPTTGYALPSTIGSANQVLTISDIGSGDPVWKDTSNIFDQSLNISNNVKFNNVNVDGTLIIGDLPTTGYALPTTSGTANQVLTISDIGSGDPVWQDPAPTNDQSLNTTDDVEFKSVTVEDDVKLKGTGPTTQDWTMSSDGDFTLKSGFNDVILRVEEDGGIMTLSDGGFENGSGRLNCEEVSCDRIMRLEDTRVSFDVDKTTFGQSIELKDSGEVACEQVTVGAPPPSIAELNLGELDFTTTTAEGLITQGATAAQATFGTTSIFRAIGSKRFVIPMNIAVGGFVKWSFDVTARSGNTINFGIHFKDLGSATSYSGGSVGTASSEFYLLTANSGSRCYKGGIPQATAFASSIASGLHEVYVNRISTDLWRLSFLNGGVLTTAPVGECEFGSEFADKFMFFYISDTAPSNSSFTFNMTGFTGSGYSDDTYRYKLEQNTNNQLELSTPSGETAIQISPNNVMVNKSMMVANNICVQSAKFGYGCCVSSTIYKGSVGTANDVTGGVPAPETFVPLGSNPATKYGNTIIRGPIQPGQSYTVRMAGRISTGPDQDSLYLRVMMGNVMVGLSTAIEAKMVDDDLDEAMFTLTVTIIPWVKVISSGVTFVQCWGMMVIHNNNARYDRAATNIGIRSTSYSQSLATATTVVTNADHDLQIEAYFEDANSANTLIVDDHEIEMKAFNQ